MIIALGESILDIGSTLGATATSPRRRSTAFVLAFLGTVALWWVYFDRSAEDSSTAIAGSDRPRPARAVRLHVLPPADGRRRHRHGRGRRGASSPTRPGTARPPSRPPCSAAPRCSCSGTCCSSGPCSGCCPGPGWSRWPCWRADPGRCRRVTAGALGGCAPLVVVIGVGVSRHDAVPGPLRRRARPGSARLASAGSAPSSANVIDRSSADRQRRAHRRGDLERMHRVVDAARHARRRRDAGQQLQRRRGPVRGHPQRRPPGRRRPAATPGPAPRPATPARPSSPRPAPRRRRASSTTSAPIRGRHRTGCLACRAVPAGHRQQQARAPVRVGSRPLGGQVGAQRDAADHDRAVAAGGRRPAPPDGVRPVRSPCVRRVARPGACPARSDRAGEHRADEHLVRAGAGQQHGRFARSRASV